MQTGLQVCHEAGIKRQKQETQDSEKHSMNVKYSPAFIFPAIRRESLRPLYLSHSPATYPLAK